MPFGVGTDPVWMHDWGGEMKVETGVHKVTLWQCTLDTITATGNAAAAALSRLATTEVCVEEDVLPKTASI